jgi:hypothetical protein
MTTVTGLTAERMLAIEGASIIDGDIVGNNLILTKHNGNTIDAGNVRGPKGDTGAQGPQGIPGIPPGGIGCRISHSAPLTIPTGVLTQITALDLELFDDGNLHPNPDGRIVAPQTGIYNVTVRANWVLNPNGLRRVEPRKYTAGSAVAEGYADTVSAAITSQHGMSFISKATVGEFFAVWVFQDSGGPLDLPIEGLQFMAVRSG